VEFTKLPEGIVGNRLKGRKPERGHSGRKIRTKKMSSVLAILLERTCEENRQLSPSSPGKKAKSSLRTEISKTNDKIKGRQVNSRTKRSRTHSIVKRGYSSHFKPETDRELVFASKNSKQTNILYAHLKRKNFVRTPDEFMHVHFRKIRAMAWLVRWLRRSLRRSGVPKQYLPGHTYLVMCPGTASSWLYGLMMSCEFRGRLFMKNKKHWQLCC